MAQAVTDVAVTAVNRKDAVAKVGEAAIDVRAEFVGDQHVAISALDDNVLIVWLEALYPANATLADLDVRREWMHFAYSVVLLVLVAVALGVVSAAAWASAISSGVA